MVISRRPGSGRAVARVLRADGESAGGCRRTARRRPGGRRRTPACGGRTRLQTLAEQGVAVGGFGEGQLGCGRLEVIAEEGGVVPITRGVDANADALEARFGAVAVLIAWGLGNRGLSRDQPRGPPRHRREEACDQRSVPQDVTSSCVRNGGANLKQEVEPHQTERPPRDSLCRGYSRRNRE